MKIEKISVNNYRLLKNTIITCDNELSLIVGKNNCGKTSLLSILNKCIGNKSETGIFEYYDFSISFQKKLYKIIESEIEFNENELNGIRVDIYISYEDVDNLANLSKLLLDLDPDNNTVILRFEYSIDAHAIDVIKKDFIKYKEKHLKVLEDNSFTKFMQKKHRRYFVFKKYSVLYDYINQKIDNNVFKLLDGKDVDISKIISFNYINARRDVSNTSETELSTLSNTYYNRTKAQYDDTSTVSDFENQIDETDIKFDDIYTKVFKELLEKISKFGGIKKDDTKIKIISQMQPAKLLKDNTTVVYSDESNYLPEHYNGLGYLNLISMIIKIETVLSQIRKDGKNDEAPADINIIFIEEPEAHTHPQMQYVFIKNIRSLLDEGKSKGDSKVQLQTFMTTHSSHIVSECNFDDLKYFVKERDSEGYNIISKNLKDLEISYQQEFGKDNNHFKFLKQYLTLNRSEIFFADKIILIEGDTERILLPSMLRKLDQENNFDIPLLSQNISIIEVGNYSEIYSKFIDFINTKTLIITDIDSNIYIDDTDNNGQPKKNKDGSTKQKTVPCPVSNGTFTSNAALKFYLNSKISDGGESSIKTLTQLTLEDKIVKYSKEKEPSAGEVNGQWISEPNGNVLIVYQTCESNAEGAIYNARSFEDAFFHINRKFFTDLSGNNVEEKIKTCKKLFQGLKNVKELFNTDNDSFYLAQNCVNKKPSLAMDILLNSKSDGSRDFINWEIPSYIKEGLIWLQKN